MKKQNQQLKNSKKEFSKYVKINFLILTLFFTNYSFNLIWGGGLFGRMSAFEELMFYTFLLSVPIVSILLVIFSIIALLDIRKNKLKGKIFSWTIIILACLGILDLIYFWIIKPLTEIM